MTEIFLEVTTLPKKSKRPCRYRGCPNLTDDASGYCAEHKATASRDYDKFGRGYNHGKRYGYQWRKLRNYFLSIHPFCEMCKRDGRYTDATEVHHILPLADGGTNDIDNLMALCKSCHSRITMTTENKGRKQYG